MKELYIRLIQMYCITDEEIVIHRWKRTCAHCMLLTRGEQAAGHSRVVSRATCLPGHRILHVHTHTSTHAHIHVVLVIILHEGTTVGVHHHDHMSSFKNPEK